jgi:hypothetical protein
MWEKNELVWDQKTEACDEDAFPQQQPSSVFILPLQPTPPLTPSKRP